MFSNRRPGLPAHTVRLLYQLGYICTGTAAGLATLCLEEQRRRIKILQKVADNAKIIRQHPRYRGSHALAAAEAAQENYEPVVIGRDGTRSRERAQGRRHSISPEGARESGRMDAGGSFVRLRYHEETTADAEERRIWRNAAQWIHSDSRTRARPSDMQHQYLPSATRDLLHTPPAVNKLTKTASKPRTRLRVRAEPVSRADLDSYKTLKIARGQKLSAALVKNRLEQRELQSIRPAVQVRVDGEDNPAFIAANPPLTEDRPDFSPEDLTHDIQLFLDTPNFTRTRHGGAFQRARVASHLWRSALVIGSLEEIRSLWDWRTVHDAVSESEMRQLCASCSSLGQRFDHDEVIGFLETMLNSKAFLASDPTFRLEQSMTTVRAILKWDYGRRPLDLRDRLLQKCLVGIDDDLIISTLAENCHELILRGEISIAKRLLRRFANRDCVKFKAYDPRMVACLDGHFAAAIERRDFVECKSLLLWKRTCFGFESVRAQLASFIKACAEPEAYGILVDFIDANGGLRLEEANLTRDVDVDSRRILLHAFAGKTSHWNSFQRLLLSLPEEECAPYQALRGILLLPETWATTHNLAEVDRRTQELHKQLTENYDPDLQRRLEETSLRIYVQSGKIDRALAMISHMHKTMGASSFAICQTALALAKQRDWKSFNRLVDVMKGRESFRFDGDAPKTFNAVIWTFSREHSAAETWDFVAAAMQDLGFRPTTSTAEIVLQAFVSNDMSEWIPRWINFVEGQGHAIYIGAEMAAALLRTYYVKYRPSHVLMMLLCRRLISLSPSLAGEHLVQLVQQAIGYDLRHVSGKYGAWEHAHAEMRLSRLDGVTGFIPSPGMVWNDQLFFHDADGNALSAETALDPLDRVHDDADGSDSPLGLEAVGPAIWQDMSSDAADHIDRENYKNIEGTMWRHICLGQHDEVLDLYHKALNPNGIPPHPVLLNIAVEASLRMNNSTSIEAERMISRAHDAGMNTSHAASLPIIHRMKLAPPQNAADAEQLCTLVHTHYRDNDEAGFRVSHHLATVVAHNLIIHGFVQHGIRLLSAIYTSKWAEQNPFDDVPMTVFLKGYIAQQTLPGIKWVVQTMLDQNLRMTKGFMRQLKQITRGNSRFMSRHPPHLLASLVQRCDQARRRQLNETRRLGWKLVKCVAKATKEGARIDVDAVDPMENYHISEDESDAAPVATAASEDTAKHFIDETYFSDEPPPSTMSHLSASEERNAPAVLGSRMDEDRKAELEFRQRMKAATRLSVERARASQLSSKAPPPPPLSQALPEDADEGGNDGDQDHVAPGTFRPFS